MAPPPHPSRREPCLTSATLDAAAPAARSPAPDRRLRCQCAWQLARRAVNRHPSPLPLLPTHAGSSTRSSTAPTGHSGKLVAARRKIKTLDGARLRRPHGVVGCGVLVGPAIVGASGVPAAPAVHENGSIRSVRGFA